MKSEKVIPRSPNKPCNYTISLQAEDMARYSASIEDLDTVACFLYFHKIRESPRKTHHSASIEDLDTVPCFFYFHEIRESHRKTQSRS